MPNALHPLFLWILPMKPLPLWNSQWWDFVPISQSRKLRLREVVTCLRALSNTQSILYNVNHVPCLASETPPSVVSKSPPRLLSLVFWLFLCLLLPTCSHVPQPSSSYLHRCPRSSHLISWQLTPPTPRWVWSSNCLLNTLPSCLRISQT